jgi:hypothetical protein
MKLVTLEGDPIVVEYSVKINSPPYPYDLVSEIGTLKLIP